MEELKLKEVIKKNFTWRLIVLVLCIFFTGLLLSTVFLHVGTYKTFETHYSAILSTMLTIKQDLLIKTITINIFSLILIIIGIAILGILYSHRIAGPLYRIKSFAKMHDEGSRFKPGIKFRNKDAIHSLADALNKMAEIYNQRFSMLSSEIKELEDALIEIDLSSSKPEGLETSIRKAKEIDDKIKKLLDTVRL